MFQKEYDVIVVGGGHAGCEAAATSAQMGASTLLVSMNLQFLGQMSCNPAMGGVAKGQIVREIDAMGGLSGVVSDKSAIQFKMLNKSKGPAMWSPRTQNDRMLFSQYWREALEQLPYLDFYQEMATEIIVKNDKAIGIKTALGIEILSKSVILTNGTFLNGKIHIGEKNFSGGRAGEGASRGITEVLTDLGFESGRMKTGTPPRVDGRSLDYQKMIPQPGDEKPQKFSYLQNIQPIAKQKDCHLSYTNPQVHDLLREGFDRSPMFNGNIQSIGPRYCPSIEDKIDRFSTKDQHQIFVEPEGWNTIEIYVNGFSTSLPEDIQYNAMQQIAGFENVKFLRPGYAIEYDYFPPTQLKHTLETKRITSLYFAGQINGTTGYEEAASQGMIAGINAVQKIREKEPFILSRNQAYIGVLIDDLITKGTDEPYRMFTSRAEYRTLLRQDNADVRLTELSHQIGLANEQRVTQLAYKQTQSEKLQNFFKKTSVSPAQMNPILEGLDTAPISQSDKMTKIITRPEVNLQEMKKIPEMMEFINQNDITEEMLEYVEINIKYQGYIEKEKRNADKLTNLQYIKIPEKFDYDLLKSLSFEAREKLKKIQPIDLAHASRISGVSPSDISILLLHMGR